MRYIIDRKTNEHERYDGQNYDATKYRIVEADSEGWIAHTGKECPLPDDARCDLRFYDHRQRMCEQTRSYPWGDAMGRIITHYRPILAEKVQEPEPALPADCIETPDLVNRLDAAHQAAAQIPDIIAQIKAKLEQYGHTVVPLSPFVAAVIAEPEPAAETPQDMSDWRNWRDGDWFECVKAIKRHGVDAYCVGEKYVYGRDRYGDLGIKDREGAVWAECCTTSSHFKPENFRFHSRPAKGEK